MANAEDAEHRLQVETEQVNGACLVRPKGTVDLYTSPVLRKRLQKLLKDKACEHVVVDLTEVDYMDSSGLATLVEALRQLRERDGQMRLAAAQQEICYVIEMAKLDKVFALDESVEQSLQKIGVAES